MGVGGSRVAAFQQTGRKQRCGVDRVRRFLGAGGGCSQQAADEAGAAVGDEAELGGVVLVLRAQNAGDVEEIAVETERGEEVSGVVGEAGGFGEGGRRMRC